MGGLEVSEDACWAGMAYWRGAEGGTGKGRLLYNALLVERRGSRWLEDAERACVIGGLVPMAFCRLSFGPSCSRLSKSMRLLSGDVDLGELELDDHEECAGPASESAL